MTAIIGNQGLPTVSKDLPQLGEDRA